MPLHDQTIAIVGATGAVGREALAILAERAHPASKVVAVASDRSVGADIPYERTCPDLPPGEGAPTATPTDSR